MILPEVYQPRPASVFILVSTALYGPAALNHMVDSMPGSLVDTVRTAHVRHRSYGRGPHVASIRRHHYDIGCKTLHLPLVPRGPAVPQPFCSSHAITYEGEMRGRHLRVISPRWRMHCRSSVRFNRSTSVELTSRPCKQCAVHWKEQKDYS